MRRLWKDESGAILSAELVVLMTTLVIGIIVGAVAIQNAVVEEMGDVSSAIGSLNQSYSYGGKRLMRRGAPETSCAIAYGSIWNDGPDTTDDPDSTDKFNNVVTCVDNADPAEDP